MWCGWWSEGWMGGGLCGVKIAAMPPPPPLGKPPRRHPTTTNTPPPRSHSNTATQIHRNKPRHVNRSLCLLQNHQGRAPLLQGPSFPEVSWRTSTPANRSLYIQPALRIGQGPRLPRYPATFQGPCRMHPHTSPHPLDLQHRSIAGSREASW